MPCPAPPPYPGRPWGARPSPHFPGSAPIPPTEYSHHWALVQASRVSEMLSTLPLPSKFLPFCKPPRLGPVFSLAKLSRAVLVSLVPSSQSSMSVWGASESALRETFGVYPADRSVSSCFFSCVSASLSFCFCSISLPLFFSLSHPNAWFPRLPALPYSWLLHRLGRATLCSAHKEAVGILRGSEEAGTELACLTVQASGMIPEAALMTETSLRQLTRV